ncbi:esterase-like activity of phytase family protein [Kaistia dalseonensis]|uniref:Phytase-like domain-containing protein n=1 Tax=Kaistia dalseonensis TaxID=410840 RepID=A0ABU0H4I6_9HYPH|nr:esterase-like activity of phytase family protein [Kaistia dalseonensis]MCX5494634.1 esterase-like activity of phytase family protein [Kaistia dalseonensis]MDQ0437214.1 hypothetical protein [Kaistia dalseonensis]
MKRLRGAIAGLLLIASVGAAFPSGFAPEPLRTTPIGNFLIGRNATRFGEFEFAGGLVLTSQNRKFGGLSGLGIKPDGHSFVSVSDMGYWFRGTLLREGGKLVGIADAQWAPMLNDKGQPLGSKRNADAEGLRLTTINGREAAYVSFERSNDLRLYRADPDLASARPQKVKLPSSLKGLVSNRGLETIALAPAKGPLAGSPVLVSERSLDKSGNHRAWIVNGPLAGAFSVVRSDDFDITDGAFLPNGDLLLLERRVIMPIGVGMRLRRIPGNQIRPGALVDGPIAMQADMLNQIDNMEGLAVSRDADGATRITLVSDDNLSIMQRTLMLEFIWQGPGSTVSN